MKNKKIIGALAVSAIAGTSAVGAVAQFCGPTSGGNLTNQQLAQSVIGFLRDYSNPTNVSPSNPIVNPDIYNFAVNLMFSLYQQTSSPIPSYEKGTNFALTKMSYTGTATVSSSGDTINFTELEASATIDIEFSVFGNDSGSFVSTPFVFSGNSTSSISGIEYAIPRGSENEVYINATYSATNFTLQS